MKTTKRYISVILCISILLSMFVGLNTGFVSNALTPIVAETVNGYDEDGIVFNSNGTVSPTDYASASTVYSEMSKDVGVWYKYLAGNLLINKMAYKAAKVTTDGWETVTQTFTTSSSADQSPLMIQLRSLQSGAVWWAACTNAYIDNIVITKTATDDEGNETQETVTTNTYDEKSIAYSYTGSFSESDVPKTGTTYTEMTVNGITKQIGVNNVFIEQHTDSEGAVTDYGYAAHIGRTQNGNSDNYSGNFPSLLIYDSNDENLGLFYPEASTTYTITFEYRLDKADTNNKAIYLDLLYANIYQPTQITFNNTQIEEYIYTETTTSTDAETGEETATETEVNEGYAVHFGIAQNGTCYGSNPGGTSYWSGEKIGAVLLYDSNASAISAFIPAKNTSYTISFKYRSDLDPDKDMSLRLSYANTGTPINSFSDSTIIVNQLVAVTGVTDGWQNVTATFETGSTVAPLMLLLGTDQYWWSANVDVWVDDITITANGEVELDTEGFIYENVIIDEDFSDVGDGALPEGWISDYAYGFLWNSAKVDTSNIAVKSDDDGTKHLNITASNGDYIVTLPDLGVENYRYSVDIRYADTSKGAFGIATDIKTDYTSAEYANFMRMENEENSKGEIQLVTRKNGHSNVVQKYFDAADCFDSGLAASGDTVNLTAYHYDNVSYYYINGIYVGSVEDYQTAEANRIGLYCSYGTDMQVLSVTAEEILSPSSAKDYFYATNNLLTEDFSSVEDGAIPENWDKEHKYVSLWAGNKVDTSNTAVKTDENGTKYLNIEAKSGDYVLTLPALGTDSYRYSVKLRYTADSVGTFGIATDISDDYTNATYVNALRVTNKTDEAAIQVVSRYKTSNGDYMGGNSVKKEHSIADYFDTETGLPAVDSVVELTAYHYDNVTYFYIDGQFVDTVADYQDITATRIGLYCSYGTDMQVLSVSADEIAPRNLTDAASVTGAAARYANAEGEAVALAGGIKLNATVDTANSLYNEENEIGIVLTSYEELGGYPLTAMSDGAAVLAADEITDGSFTETIVNLTVAQMDTKYAVRAYVKTADGVYYYSDTVYYTPARLTELYYLDENTTDETKAMIEAFLNDSTVFLGSDAESITFSLFSDMHYKEEMFISSVADLNSILDRANSNNVDFVLQAGDFSNDIAGSPELTNAFLNNSYSLPVYGIYGNHELETSNAMSYVTGTLTNSNVVWGTSDGAIATDGSIGYYYYDVKGFRFVMTDTNYSYNPNTKQWEHNYTGSYGAPKTNIYENSLGPVQLKWLENVLNDAAKQKLHCIVVSHAPLNVNWSDNSPDSDAVRKIFAKVNAISDRTVMMAINGHIHTNRSDTVDNVFYLDTNCVRNGYSTGSQNFYEGTGITYDFIPYDADGNPLSEAYAREINTLTKNPYSRGTIYYADPLSAIVKISANGTITIEGQETTWLGDLTPPNTYDGLETRISDHDLLIK